MAKQDKTSEGSESARRSLSVGKVTESPASDGNDLLSSAGLVTPRMAAEREIARTVEVAGECIRSILSERANDSMAYAVLVKAQGQLAMQVLDAANAIGAANGGKASPQLVAASMQAGSLSLALAQRLAAKRNAATVRRVVDAADSGAYTSSTVASSTAEESSAADSGNEVSNKLDTEK